MTIRTHLQIAGALLLLLGAAHPFFSRYFRWTEELQKVSLLTRQVFVVHAFFIGLTVAMLGAASLFFPDAILDRAPLSRVFLTGVVVFWTCRLVIQFAVYDSAIWRGRRFYTIMHVVFSVFWVYVVSTYSVALRRVW